jgi:hypothetical protein
LNLVLRHRSFHPGAATLLFFVISLFFSSVSTCYANQQDTSAQAKTDSQSAAAPTGKISGHVYRADNGEPLAKAIVTLLVDTYSPDLMTRTESDGSYSFTNIDHGKYAVSASRTGFITGAHRSSILLENGKKLDNIDIRLQQASVISGRVTDPDGDPVEGVEIFAVYPSYSEGGRVLEADRGEAYTNDKGEYRLSGLEPGNYFVRVGGSGKNTGAIVKEGTWAYRTSYYPGLPQMDGAESIAVKAGAEVSGINLQVAGSTRHAYKLTIKLTGAPVVSAPQISVLPGDEAVKGVSPRSDGESGAFLLSGVSPGKYTIVARSFAYRKSSEAPGSEGSVEHARMFAGMASVTIEDANASVNVHMADAGEIRGKIGREKPGKSSLEKLNLELVARSGISDALEGPDPEVEIKPDGSFAITNILPGQYFFGLEDSSSDDYVKNVTCEGRDYTLQTVEIEIGTKLADCRVTISDDLGSISGMVLDGGKSVPGVFVIAIPQSTAIRQNPQYTITERTDSDGQFQLKAIPGDYFLFAVRPNEQDSYYALDFAERNLASAERVSVKSGDKKTVVLKLATAQ